MWLQEKRKLRSVITDHILVSEDDDNIQEGLIDVLESEVCQVTSAIDGETVWPSRTSCQNRSRPQAITTL